ncbi:hypothetical protein QCE63_35170 [Caballeronia sp. LZ065]|uniref:hypothetical protein n=1 Tax=Caballeronia sp. LZ065 TaxID=3038571 RepID=UPI00285612FC|nr:hypothetical protein [Caballeronia sp. LZ065]MDR5784638.1 hypothetical protein [Caballeronia sp. LZ065]
MKTRFLALILFATASIHAHADPYFRDCIVLATGVENAGDYRAKGYTKDQYDQYLAERVWRQDLNTDAFLLWDQGAKLAYRPEYSKMSAKAVAAKVYAYCLTHQKEN